MTWEIFLTTWIILQMIGKIIRQPKRSKLKNHTEGQLIGSILGIVSWCAGMILCLYYGGFYD